MLIISFLLSIHHVSAFFFYAHDSFCNLVVSNSETHSHWRPQRSFGEKMERSRSRENDDGMESSAEEVVSTHSMKGFFLDYHARSAEENHSPEEDRFVEHSKERESSDERDEPLVEDQQDSSLAENLELNQSRGSEQQDCEVQHNDDLSSQSQDSPFTNEEQGDTTETGDQDIQEDNDGQITSTPSKAGNDESKTQELVQVDSLNTTSSSTSIRRVVGLTGRIRSFLKGGKHEKLDSKVSTTATRQDSNPMDKTVARTDMLDVPVQESSVPSNELEKVATEEDLTKLIEQIKGFIDSIGIFMKTRLSQEVTAMMHQSEIQGPSTSDVTSVANDVAGWMKDNIQRSSIQASWCQGDNIKSMTQGFGCGSNDSEKDSMAHGLVCGPNYNANELHKSPDLDLLLNRFYDAVGVMEASVDVIVKMPGRVTNDIQKTWNEWSAQLSWIRTEAETKQWAAIEGGQDFTEELLKHPLPVLHVDQAVEGEPKDATDGVQKTDVSPRGKDSSCSSLASNACSTKASSSVKRAPPKKNKPHKSKEEQPRSRSSGSSKRLFRFSFAKSKRKTQDPSSVSGSTKDQKQEDEAGLPVDNSNNTVAKASKPVESASGERTIQEEDLEKRSHIDSHVKSTPKHQADQEDDTVTDGKLNKTCLNTCMPDEQEPLCCAPFACGNNAELETTDQDDISITFTTGDVATEAPSLADAKPTNITENPQVESTVQDNEESMEDRVESGSTKAKSVSAVRSFFSFWSVAEPEKNHDKEIPESQEEASLQADLVKEPNVTTTTTDQVENSSTQEQAETSSNDGVHDIKENGSQDKNVSDVDQQDDMLCAPFVCCNTEPEPVDEEDNIVSPSTPTSQLEFEETTTVTEPSKVSNIPTEKESIKDHLEDTNGNPPLEKTKRSKGGKRGKSFSKGMHSIFSRSHRSGKVRKTKKAIPVENLDDRGNPSAIEKEGADSKSASTTTAANALVDPSNVKKSSDNRSWGKPSQGTTNTSNEKGTTVDAVEQSAEKATKDMEVEHSNAVTMSEINSLSIEEHPADETTENAKAVLLRNDLSPDTEEGNKSEAMNQQTIIPPTFQGEPQPSENNTTKMAEDTADSSSKRSSSKSKKRGFQFRVKKSLVEPVVMGTEEIETKRGVAKFAGSLKAKTMNSISSKNFGPLSRKKKHEQKEKSDDTVTTTQNTAVTEKDALQVIVPSGRSTMGQGSKVETEKTSRLGALAQGTERSVQGMVDKDEKVTTDSQTSHMAPPETVRSTSRGSDSRGEKKRIQFVDQLEEFDDQGIERVLSSTVDTLRYESKEGKDKQSVTPSTTKNNERSEKLDETKQEMTEDDKGIELTVSKSAWDGPSFVPLNQASMESEGSDGGDDDPLLPRPESYDTGDSRSQHTNILTDTWQTATELMCSRQGEADVDDSSEVTPVDAAFFDKALAATTKSWMPWGKKKVPKKLTFVGLP